MPHKPKRPCAYPGCPELTTNLYCEKHQSEQRKKYDKYERSADVRQRYGRSWGKIRNRYFQLHPFCEQCFAEGKMTMAEEVHHIVPVKRGGTNEEANLMSLCKSCHNKKHVELGDR